MGLIDAFVPPAAVARAVSAFHEAEAARRQRILDVLTSASSADMPPDIVDELFVASSQIPSLRAASKAVGTGMLKEILDNVADQLSKGQAGD